MKTIETLTPDDLIASPVWEYSPSDQAASPILSPVVDLPVSDLTFRLVRAEFTTVAGRKLLGVLDNFSVSRPAINQHFITALLWISERWFPLARYHDVTYHRHSPVAVATLLEETVSNVFPLFYVITDGIVRSSATFGQIDAEPAIRLSLEDLVALAMD